MIGRVCYGYKYFPDAVLDMPYRQFLYLATKLDEYREEESIAQALAVWGQSSTGKNDESINLDTPEDLRRLFGG